MENSEKAQTDDEVSLIDLLVVLLKRRFLILGFLAAAVLLFLVWNFGYVAYRNGQAAKESKEERGVETHLAFMLTPETSLFVLGLDPNAVANRIFKDPTVVLAAIKEADIESLMDMKLSGFSDPEVMFLVKQLLIEGKNPDGMTLSKDKKIFRYYFENGAFGMAFRFEDPDKANAFLLALYARINEAAQELFRPQARSAVEDYEKIRALPVSTVLDQTNTARYYSAYAAAKRYLEGNQKPFVMIGEPYEIVTIEPKESAPKMAIIFIVAAIFLSIFLAFVLEYIERVKSDPESSARIRKALGK